MFKKLKSLGKGSGGKHKYRLDVSVRSLDGLPEGVAAVRVVWARQAKVQVTKVAAVSAGALGWGRGEVHVCARIAAAAGAGGSCQGTGTRAAAGVDTIPASALQAPSHGTRS